MHCTKFYKSFSSSFSCVNIHTNLVNPVFELLVNFVPLFFPPDSRPCDLSVKLPLLFAYAFLGICPGGHQPADEIITLKGREQSAVCQQQTVVAIQAAIELARLMYV